MNSAAIMRQFRLMPGLREIRLIRGKAVSNQFGPSRSGSEPVDEVEKSMLRSGGRSQEIEHIGGRDVLHFNGPLIARNDADNNCLQCHQVPEGTVLGGLSVQVDLSSELREARIVPLFAFLVLGIFGLLIVFALRRLFTPVSSTAMQIADTMQHGERGNFTHRLHDIPTGTDEVRQIVESTNRFFATLEQNIGGIANEIEMITGHLPGELKDNMVVRARHAVDLMLYAARLKQALEEDRDLGSAFARLSHVLHRDFDLQHFGIFESLNGSSELKPVVMVGMPDDWLTRLTQPDQKTPSVCPASSSHHAVDGLIVDVSRDPDTCCRTCGQFNEDPHLNHICIPIWDSNESRTIISILYEGRQARSMHGITARLSYVMRIITPELRSKRLLKILKNIAIHDPLTGLFNRRFLDEIKPGLVASIRRRETSLGVLLCDIDLFKEVNDNYGHETGDAVLQGIADAFKKEMRDSDYVIRMGGEEILVLLTDADRHKSLEIAERLRISKRTFKGNNCIFSKTVSIGVAIFPDDNPRLMDTIQCADEALYIAKHQGRNRVIAYQPVESGAHAADPTPHQTRIKA